MVALQCDLKLRSIYYFNVNLSTQQRYWRAHVILVAMRSAQIAHTNSQIRRNVNTKRIRCGRKRSAHFSSISFHHFRHGSVFWSVFVYKQKSTQSVCVCVVRWWLRAKWVCVIKVLASMIGILLKIQTPLNSALHVDYFGSHRSRLVSERTRTRLCAYFIGSFIKYGLVWCYWNWKWISNTLSYKHEHTYARHGVAWHGMAEHSTQHTAHSTCQRTNHAAFFWRTDKSIGQ